MPYKRRVLAEIDVDNLRKMLEDCNADNPDRWRLKSFNPICFFCGHPQPVFVYASDCSPSGKQVETWRWCTCGDCSTEIEKENWMHLERRIVDWIQQHTGYASATVKKSARVLFQEFPAHAIKLSRPRKQRSQAAHA
jgi:hypothetical protein